MIRKSEKVICWARVLYQYKSRRWRKNLFWPKGCGV